MAKLVEIKVSDHHASFFHGMSEVRRNKRFFDIKLCVGDEEIESHKAVLAAFSPYFSEQFDDAFQKSGQDRIDLTDKTNVTVLTSILDYMYSGSISFQTDDVAVLLRTLHLFKMQSVKDLCEEYLVDQDSIDAENYVTFLNVAEELRLEILKEAALHYIKKNFREIHASEEFRKLTKDQVVNSVLVHPESPLRPHSTLHIFVNRDFLHYKCNVRDKSLTRLEPRPKLNSCAMVKHKKSMYAFGTGFENEIGGTGFKYDTTTSEWTRVVTANILIKPSAGICSRGDGIYFIGGCENGKLQNTCVRYDVGTSQWTTLANTEYGRTGPGVVSCNSSIYVFGGYSSDTGTAVERYDPREGKWFIYSSVQLQSFVSSAVVSEHNVCCLERHSDNLINFDTRSSKCTDVTPKFGHSLASLDGRLYIGHREGIAEYNPYALEWNEILEKSLIGLVLIA